MWSDSNGTRLAFPSSPFAVHVNPGLPTADMSFVEGYTNQSGEKVDKKGAGANKASSPSKKPSDTARSDIWDEVIAGDAVSIKPILLDNFGNLTHVTDGALTAHAIAPDGKREAVSISQQAKPNGTTIYELRHEVTLRGEHEVHVLLSSNPIKGSPILLDVQPAPPEPHVCKLLQPPSTENLVADYDAPTTLLITTFDKFGNACKHGGLTIGARIQLIKQSNSDMTVLMPNNHNVSVEDYNDGTYGVTIQIKINATVRLTVNLDKNLPANSGELPSVVRDIPLAPCCPQPATASPITLADTSACLRDLLRRRSLSSSRSSQSRVSRLSRASRLNPHQRHRATPVHLKTPSTSAAAATTPDQVSPSERRRSKGSLPHQSSPMSVGHPTTRRRTMAHLRLWRLHYPWRVWIRATRPRLERMDS